MSAQIKNLLEGKIDFYAQDVADTWTRIALITATVVSFLAGFNMESQKLTFAIFGATLTTVLLLVVPPWPYLNRHPVMWSNEVEGRKER